MLHKPCHCQPDIVRQVALLLIIARGQGGDDAGLLRTKSRLCVKTVHDVADVSETRSWQQCYASLLGTVMMLLVRSRVYPCSRQAFQQTQLSFRHVASTRWCMHVPDACQPRDGRGRLRGRRARPMCGCGCSSALHHERHPDLASETHAVQAQLPIDRLPVEHVCYHVVHRYECCPTHALREVDCCRRHPSQSPELARQLNVVTSRHVC